MNNKNDSITLKKNIIEDFTVAVNYNNYGNVLSLKDTKNLPVYSVNQAIYELDDVYRIDTLFFVFNNSESTDSPKTLKYDPSKTLYIQYMDGGGNMRYLKSKTITASPPNLSSLVNATSTIILTDIVDENDLTVYTSKICLIIGDSTNKIINYTDPAGYIKEYGIFGGDRSLYLKADYDTLKSTLNSVSKTIPNISDGLTTDIKINTFEKIYNAGNNIKIYSLQLTISQLPVVATATSPNKKPFYITIKYNNSLYPANVFTINKQYIIRNDINKLSSTATTAFIFLTEPIIANNLIFEITNEETYTLTISSITINGIEPTSTDITDFKRTVNVSLNNNIEGDVSLCPNIDNLIEKQTKTQQICDNLEYQDKIKSEKLRLERNKQYLIKLKQQQEQIDDLNKVIQDLETKRQARSTIADQARVLQYQKQKGDASTIRDLANQRLESQDSNKLFLDLNINNLE